MLAGAKQGKHLPGRPQRDTPEPAWLAACCGRGSVRPCFAATAELRLIGCPPAAAVT